MNKFNLSLIIITISVFLVTACIDELEDDPIPNPYESYLIIDDNVKNEESVENVVKNNE
ncbi:hypothetical protein HOF65_03860 [bacterium]|jgi:hypothetical protein|nr:hypothetical protein [bacterium]MBT6778513.1 hypothetical protein [bacterium]